MRARIVIARIEARLWRAWPVDLCASVATAVAILAAPDGDRIAQLDPSQYFATLAQVGATLLVAVALFAGALDDSVDYHVRRWLSSRSFVYLGAATTIGLAGAFDARAVAGHRWLFALSVGAALGGILTVLLMGRANIAQRHTRGPKARAHVLDPHPRESSPTPRQDADHPPTME
jgi:hypothetical protein